MSRPSLLAVLALLFALPASPQDVCCDVTIPAPFDRHPAAACVKLLYPGSGSRWNALEVMERAKDGRLLAATTRERWTFDAKAGEHRKP